MRRAADGDVAARRSLIERHGPALMRMLRIAARHTVAAEDAFQETFAAAFRSAATYDPDAGPVRSWLFAIARNGLRGAHRKQAREVVTEPNDFALGISAGFGADAPDAQLDADERRVLLAQALSTLSEDEREILLLRDVEGLSGEQVAALLGIGLAALKSRLHRARLRLMAAYRKQEAGVTAYEKSVAGMRCRDVLAHLSSYIDGELGDAERSRIDAHLRGCNVCERFGGRFAASIHELRSALGADSALDTETVQRLCERLAQG